MKKQYVVVVSNEFSPEDRTIYGPFDNKEEAEKYGTLIPVPRSLVRVEPLINPKEI